MAEHQRLRQDLSVKNANLVLYQFLNIGQALLEAGGEANRVEDTLTRLGHAYGAREMHVFVITSSIVITMDLINGAKVTQTRRIYKACGQDFTKLEMLNTLSRDYCSQPMPTKALEERVKQIIEDKPDVRLLYLGCSIGVGSYAIYFGGTIGDGIFAVLLGLVIYFLQLHLSPRCPNIIVYNLLCTLIAGSLICGVAALVPGIHQEPIMIGDIMLLIPTLAMTNSIRDILVGDTLFGILQFIETMLWTVALASGFMISMMVFGG